MREFSGRIKSGSGAGSAWLEAERDMIYKTLGFHVFPGTLRVKLFRPVIFSSSASFESAANPGRFFNLTRAALNGYTVFIKYGRRRLDIINVLADVKLRDVLNLSDGQIVSIAVDDIYVRDLGACMCFLHRIKNLAMDVTGKTKQIVKSLKSVP